MDTILILRLFSYNINIVFYLSFHFLYLPPFPKRVGETGELRMKSRCRLFKFYHNIQNRFYSFLFIRSRFSSFKLTSLYLIFRERFFNIINKFLTFLFWNFFTFYRVVSITKLTPEIHVTTQNLYEICLIVTN